MKVPEDIALKHVRTLEKLTVSHAWQGAGSALFLELGEPSPRLPDIPAKNLRGECSIMIQWSWRFERRSEILVGSFSSPRRISDLPKKLIGLKIKSISFFFKTAGT